MRRDQPEGAAATPAEAADPIRDRPLNPCSPRILILPLRRLLLLPGRPTLRRVVRPFACPRPVVAGGTALRPALDPVSLITDHDILGRRALPYRRVVPRARGGDRRAGRPPPVRPSQSSSAPCGRPCGA